MAELNIFFLAFSFTFPFFLFLQVHATLTSLLLHLNEPDPEVVRACKAALRQAGSMLEAGEKDEPTGVNALFQTHLLDDGQLDYVLFLGDLVKLIAAHFEEWVHSTYLPAAASYFKSSVPELRANAALYVGLLCGIKSHGGTAELQQNRSVSISLTRLLHDPVKTVRLQSMEAINLMFR